MTARVPAATCYEAHADELEEHALPVAKQPLREWDVPPSMAHAGVRVFGSAGASPACLAVTPDGSHLVAGCYPNTLKIWRLSDGRLERNVGQLAFNEWDELAAANGSPPDRAWPAGDLARASDPSIYHNNFRAEHDDEREGENGLWDDGKLFAGENFYDDAPLKLSTKRHGHTGEIVNIATSNDRIIAVSTGWAKHATLGYMLRGLDSPGQTKLWDLHTGKWLRDLGKQAAQCLAITQDGSSAAIALGSQIKLIRLSDGNSVRTVTADPQLYSMAFSPDASLLFMHGGHGVGMRDLLRGGYRPLEASACSGCIGAP